jgi:hypothetical protein
MLLRPNLNSLLLFAIAAQLTMPSGGLASEPSEAPVRMDQEQVSGEIEILASEFTGREFQLDRVVCNDTRLNGLFRARPPNHNGFLTLNLEGECLDGRKRSVLFVAVPGADKAEIGLSGQGTSREA